MGVSSKLYWEYRRNLRTQKTAIELLRFICKMLIEIWWNTTNEYRNRD